VTFSLLGHTHSPFSGTIQHTPPSWTRSSSLPLLGHDVPPSRALSLTSPSPSDPPPFSTPDPAQLHLEVSILLMMFLFGHTVEIRRCTFQRHTDDSHLPKDRFVLVEGSHSFPLVGRSLSRPPPIPCNVTGVSRGRIPITVSSTCLHG
jgi:hypothetical protein